MNKPTYEEMTALCRELLGKVPEDDLGSEDGPYQSEERGQLLSRAEEMIARAERVLKRSPSIHPP